MPSQRKTNPIKTNQLLEKITAFSFGIIFVITLLVLAVYFPNPTPFQYTIFRVVLSLACAGIVAVIPGFLSVRTDMIGIAIRASGAIAVFVMVYLVNPAQLVAIPTNLKQHSEGPISPNISNTNGPVTIIQQLSYESSQQDFNKP